MRAMGQAPVMTTSVTIKDHRDLRRLEALADEDDVAAFARYEIGIDGTFDFFYIEVDERFDGQGVGGQLATGVVEFARSEGIKIRPTCDFLQKYLDKHEEARDVVAPADDSASDEADAPDADQPTRDREPDRPQEQREEAELGSEADEPSEVEAPDEGTDTER